jgi:hypothetical protein
MLVNVLIIDGAEITDGGGMVDTDSTGYILDSSS